MPRLEASRPRLVRRSVGLSVGLQNKFCYEVAFKTRFALNERDISPKQKQTSKQKQQQFLFIYSYPLSNRGDMARDSGAEVPGIHDDVVLVQLVLIHSG